MAKPTKSGKPRKQSANQKKYHAHMKVCLASKISKGSGSVTKNREGFHECVEDYKKVNELNKV